MPLARLRRRCGHDTIGFCSNVSTRICRALAPEAERACACSAPRTPVCLNLPAKRSDYMKFLCIGYLDQKRMNALSKTQIDAVMSECPAFMEEFFASGQVLLVAGTPPETKSIQRVDGEVKVTDGPVEGADEAMGCVFLVEASDISEAIRIAALHPTTRIEAGEKLGFRIAIAPVHYFEERELKKAP